MLGDVNNFCVNDFDVTLSDHALILVNILSYFCHQDTDNLREAPESIIWDDVKMTNFKNNLSCICKNAFSKDLTDIHNNPVLSEKERIDQMVNKISSVLNCAALKEQEIALKRNA